MAETAVAMIVPDADGLVGPWRRTQTGDGAAGMPAHVTLIYPFVPTEKLTTEGVATAERVLASFDSFDLALTECRFWDDGPGTLYLEPEPAQPFVAMTEALVRAFPDYPPYGGAFDEIVPHLTVAHGERELLETIAAALRPALPLRTHVTDGVLVEHTADGWQTRNLLPLNRPEATTQS